MWQYWAIIEKIVDGDTIDARIDVGFYLTTTQRLRLLGSTGGVNAYEMHGINGDLGRTGKIRVSELLPVGSRVVITTQKKDAFGRFLAQVTLPDGRNLGDVLLAEGLAVPWS